MLFTYLYRVVKETMRGEGGGNITKSHAEDVSLWALFLIEASKKVDLEFRCSQSTAHTVREANRDINILKRALLETKVTTESDERTSPPFTDPVEIGHRKIGTTSWVADTLAATTTTTDDLEMNVRNDEAMDINYELSDVI